MRFLRPFLSAAVLLAAALPAAAQQPENGPEFFGDWGYRCAAPEAEAETAPRQCEIFQTLITSEGEQQLLHFAIGYVAEVERPVGVLVVPLGVTLPPGIAVRVDEEEPMEFDYNRCDQQGCRIELLIGEDLIEQMRAGNQMVVAIVNGQGERIGIPVSLIGFTRAITTLTESRQAG